MQDYNRQLQQHEGTLVLDEHHRYCIYEPDQPAFQAITLTSGCALEVLLNREWISGHVEGDGTDYWLFADTGGKFKLAEGWVVCYTESPMSKHP